MSMKKLFVVLWLVLACAVGRAAPSPPIFLGATPPTNGFTITNITYVFTNVAMVTPVATFPQVTVYGTNVFTFGNTLSWTLSSDPAVTGYRCYYGLVTGSVTNQVTLTSSINALALFKVLTVNQPYWAYVTAIDSVGNESAPSAVVSFIPTH